MIAGPLERLHIDEEVLIDFNDYYSLSSPLADRAPTHFNSSISKSINLKLINDFKDKEEDGIKEKHADAALLYARTLTSGTLGAAQLGWRSTVLLLR